MTPLPPPLTLSKIWYLRFLSIYASKIARKPLYVAMLRRHVATNITNWDVRIATCAAILSRLTPFLWCFSQQLTLQYIQYEQRQSLEIE